MTSIKSLIKFLFQNKNLSLKKLSQLNLLNQLLLIFRTLKHHCRVVNPLDKVDYSRFLLSIKKPQSHLFKIT
jgi:hypothetical protein